MTRILLNVINDNLKKRLRQPDTLAIDDENDELGSLKEPSPGPEEQLSRDEISTDLLNALKRLPSSLLNPLLLRELEDLSYAEIAGMLDIPQGTVMSRLFRARKLVKGELTKSTDDATKMERADHDMQ
jgi:RNA polymerase sigma-70 factor (ECF subfamily)